jgi:16S rRNA (guanine966-N2)-methyltransferase
VNVTRIVAGTAGGRTLRVPAGGTRPTSDRVREALFSRLEHAGAIAGARVLDLYAGSGALGLEAASRGAGQVVLVEAAKGAAQACRDNAATLGLGARVVNRRVQAYLAEPPADVVDLALLDPPYDTAEEDLGDVLEALLAHLADDALVVVERSIRNEEPRWPAGIDRTDQRRYGETVLWFAEAAPAES